jgi:hypothetical protein
MRRLSSIAIGSAAVAMASLVVCVPESAAAAGVDTFSMSLRVTHRLRP